MDLQPFLDLLPEARVRLEKTLKLLRDCVHGVCRRYYPGIYIYGRPGTGKTYTIKQKVADSGRSFYYHCGYVTPMGLLDLFEEYADAVIVLDDVAEIFRNRRGLQFFLAALGKQPELDEHGRLRPRVIQYRRGRSIERTVVFSGGVIGISNLEPAHGALNDAFRSRSDVLHYSPPNEEIASLMLELAAHGYTLNGSVLSSGQCREVALFVIEESLQLGCPLDLRVLIDKSFPKRLQFEDGECESHWKDLVRAAIQEEIRQPSHPPNPHPPRGLRRQLVQSQRDLARMIYQAYPDRESRLNAWRAQTGLSQATFYRGLGMEPPPSADAT